MLARQNFTSQSVLLKNGQPLKPSVVGLRYGRKPTISLEERRGRLAACVSAWRSLEWRQALHIPFPPADAAQIQATRLPSPLRGVTRQDFTRHLPCEVRAWALDSAQDLLLFIEQSEDGPPYPVHSISTKTGRRHPRAARLPSLAEEGDPWLDSNEDIVRVHGRLVGVAHAGWLRVYAWRTGHLLLDIPCSDDFMFFNDSYVVTTDFNPDTLLPSILFHSLSRVQPRDTPAYRFNLPKLRSTLDGAEVFVRLAADNPSPTSRFGAFYADLSLRHRAMFLRLEVFALTGPNSSDDHASMLCIPLDYFESETRLRLLGEDLLGTRVVPWHVWGPSACGMIPPAAGESSEPSVFGCRAARVVSGSSLHVQNSSRTSTSLDNTAASELEQTQCLIDPSGVYFEVFDFHLGRIALARRALERSGAALDDIRRIEATEGGDMGPEDVLVMDSDAGAWSLQTSGQLDTRIWDVSLPDGVGSASHLCYPYLSSRRKIPDEHVLRQRGGKALLTEDALCYVPVRDFVTGEPQEYVAFVF